MGQTLGFTSPNGPSSTWIGSVATLGSRSSKGLGASGTVVVPTAEEAARENVESVRGAMDEDWRIEAGGDEVRGRTFSLRPYVQPRPDWDHDHCELCGAKLMEGGAHGAFADGYATPYQGREGSFTWVCESCWDDLSGALGMRLARPEP